MPSHFVHFVIREVVPWDDRRPRSTPHAESQPPDAGFSQPEFHRTQAETGPAAAVKEGDTIWLIGRLRFGSRLLPPALDARIDVTEVDGPLSHVGSGVGFRYRAAPSSRWFPYLDATPVIAKLASQRRDSQERQPLAPDGVPVGRALRRMRRLHDAQPLVEWEEELHRRPMEFVSYRQKDGTRRACVLVQRLIADGTPVFWDRWSLPRRMAERRERLCNTALDGSIQEALRAARVVWGVESPLYGAPESYSAQERTMAVALGKYRTA